MTGVCHWRALRSIPARRPGASFALVASPGLGRQFCFGASLERHDLPAEHALQSGAHTPYPRRRCCVLVFHANSAIGRGCALMETRARTQSGVRGRRLPRMDCFERRLSAAPPAFFPILPSPLYVGCSTSRLLTRFGQRRPLAPRCAAPSVQSLPSSSDTRRPRVHPRRRGEMNVVYFSTIVY
jgi:hypothetical protein